jgi:formylglycine-generating enzyme required for sulfatase activity
VQQKSIRRLWVLAVALLAPACATSIDAGPSNVNLPKAGTILRDCADCPEIVVVPAGSLRMGSDAFDPDGESNEKPQHLVTIPASFGVGRQEVTVEQFRRFVEASSYEASAVCYTDPDGDGQYVDMARAGYGWSRPGFPQYEQGPQEPVTCVTWFDAQAYTAWLSEVSGKTYRLLTEAEWEYAARAGSTSPFFWDSSSADACTYGNGADKQTLALEWWPSKWPVAACDDGHLYTSAAGSYKPNRFGLFDLTGNVSEWVQDCYAENYASAPTDGAAAGGDCAYRVVRGGNWGNSPNRQRSAARDWEKPGMTGHSFGFRIAREL